MSDVKVVPAQLSFLAIYNPSLGTTDETFQDQITYWYSKTARVRRKNADTNRHLQEEENEKLRQIGLAQGMVDFAKSFSKGQPVDSVETEKSRIIMHELEKSWWILASIDLTRLPIISNPSSKQSTTPESTTEPTFEYSSREVSPPALLLQDLIAAYRTFLLHNGSSLSELFIKMTKQKFCGLLERFWNRFAQNWDVLLHENPAVNIFGGLKLASGGELGMGVGEEEWGSGEREVLEEFARRTDGLVDLMVSRFGEPSPTQFTSPNKPATEKGRSQQHKVSEPWMGAGSHAQAVDGVVFSGTGAISRSSLRDISHWVQSVYAYGEHAYGVKDNPKSDRKKRKRRTPPGSQNEHVDKSKGKTAKASSAAEPTKQANVITPPGIPPPIVSAVERSLERAISAHDVRRTGITTPQRSKSPTRDAEGWTKYLTFGYGSAWGNTDSTHAPIRRSESSMQSEDTEQDERPSMRHIDPEPDIDREAEFEERLKTQIHLEENGHFIIGLKGSMDEDDEAEDDEDAAEEWNERTMLRTLHIEIIKPLEEHDGSSANDASTPTPLPNPKSKRKTSRLRVVVYVHRPFIYTFLFNPLTESLSLPSFYRNLHTFFAPLHRPLSASTSPARVTARLEAASHTYTTSTESQAAGSQITEQQHQPIYDLAYDPRSLSVHASIPNIPIPGSLAAEGLKGAGTPEGWSRTEALNVHSAVLEMVRSTRPNPGGVAGGGERELERSVKTGRGWWVVWMRVDDTQSAQTSTSGDRGSSRTMLGSENEQNKSGERNDYFATGPEEESPPPIDDAREAILVRRARDALPPSKGKARTTSGIWGFGMGSGTGKDAGSGWGPARLAEGVGIDARRYVEGLLSLNR